MLGQKRKRPDSGAKEDEGEKPAPRAASAEAASSAEADCHTSGFEHDPSSILIRCGEEEGAVTVDEWASRVSLGSDVDPLIEVKRAEAVTSLRRRYLQLCKDRFGWRLPPKESFNRWLMERLLGCSKHTAEERDPLLPLLWEPAVSPSMSHEILEDMPVKLQPLLCFTDNAATALGHVKTYASFGLRRLDALRGRDDLLPRPRRKELEKVLEDAQSWARRHRDDATLEQAKAKVQSMVDACGEELRRCAREEVEAVCTDMAKLADAKAREVMALVASRAGEDRGSAVVELVEKEGGVVALQCEGEAVEVKAGHLQKLRELHRRTRGEGEDGRFLARAYAMLRRYQSFFGLGAVEGAGLHAAVPPRVMHLLSRDYGVCFEAFASPLNCHFRRYCSAFSDTDRWFGSCGSFLDFHPTSGSFEVNPPFQEDLMDAMVDHMEHLLALASPPSGDATKADDDGEAAHPLCFIIFVPHWTNPPCRAIERIKASRFQRASMVQEGRDHQYVSGLQHRVDARGPTLFTAVHPSLVVWLMNDEAVRRWPVTEEKRQRLAEVWRGKEE